MIPVDVVPRVSAGRQVIGFRIGHSWPQQDYVTTILLFILPDHSVHSFCTLMYSDVHFSFGTFRIWVSMLLCFSNAFVPDVRRLVPAAGQCKKSPLANVHLSWKCVKRPLLRISHCIFAVRPRLIWIGQSWPQQDYVATICYILCMFLACTDTI